MDTRFYWCSFYADNAPLTAFEYHGPWWISGYAAGANHEYDQPIIVAAVAAESEVAAMEVLRLAFDAERPASLTQRFCEPKGWAEPYSERFPKADWMQWPWPAPKTEGA